MILLNILSPFSRLF